MSTLHCIHSILPPWNFIHNQKKKPLDNFLSNFNIAQFNVNKVHYFSNQATSLLQSFSEQQFIGRLVPYILFWQHSHCHYYTERLTVRISCTWSLLKFTSWRMCSKENPWSETGSSSKGWLHSNRYNRQEKGAVKKRWRLTQTHTAWMWSNDLALLHTCFWMYRYTTIRVKISQV